MRIVLTIIISLVCGILHGVCQHYHHLYCRSNIILFLMLDESRLCKLLHTVSILLESNAVTKFNIVSSNLKHVYEYMKDWHI